MEAARLFFILLGVVLLVVAAFVTPPRVQLSLLGWASVVTGWLLIPAFAALN